MGFLDLTREDKTGQFLTAAGKTKWDGLFQHFDESYKNNLKEEAKELLEAISNYIVDPNLDNRAELCKEWADVQVVLSNIAWYLKIPADAAYNRVVNNNMTKVGPDGKVKLREDGKILKPKNYVKADMSGL